MAETGKDKIVRDEDRNVRKGIHNEIKGEKQMTRKKENTNIRKTKRKRNMLVKRGKGNKKKSTKYKRVKLQKRRGKDDANIRV